MTFLNPLILLGLAAAAIPLIIHLFNFRRPQTVNFSSLAFLHELKKSTMQRVRVKQWLLLALRTLAIASLILAFARPTMTGPLAGQFGGSGRTSTALILDQSASMTLRDGSGAYLDQAKTLAGALLGDFELGDEWLIESTPSLEPTASFLGNQASVEAALEDAGSLSGSEKLTAALRRAGQSLLDRPAVNRDVVIVSDFQASMVSDSSAIELPVGTRLMLMPVGTDGRGNLAVTDVRVVSQIISEAQPVRFEATIVNYGSEDVRGLVASIVLEDERVAQATVDVSASSEATAEFVVSPREKGWLSGTVEIDDNQYLFDNQRAFTLHVPEERRVLLVNGTGSRSAYLELVLSSQLSAGSARFVSDRIDETALASTTLGGYDAVVLSGVQTLSSGEQAAIEQYVRNGGGVLVFPGEGMDLGEYNAFLASIGAGSFSAPEGDITSGTTIGTFDRVDAAHPLFEGMFESQADGQAPQLEQPVILRVAPYAPSVGGEQSIISLTGGLPFLHEIRVDQGSVMLFAVEAGASWSDFPVRGLFLPLIYRSLYFLSSTGSVSGESMVAGTTSTLLLSSSSGSGIGAGSIRVRDEAGQEYIPEQRSVFGGQVLTLEGPFFLPGVYDVLQGDELLRRVVVHPEPAESRLALAEPESVRDHLAELTGTEVFIVDAAGASGESLEEQLRAARTGVELWNVFLGLALIFLIAEMLVAKVFRPETAS